MSEIPLLRRLTVTLSDSERVALAAIAEQDLRPPKHQIAWLIRQEAIRRGLVNEESDTETLAGTGVTLRVS